MSIKEINQIDDCMLLSEVFDKISAAEIVVDENGLVIKANQFAKDMFPKELYNQKWLKIVQTFFIAQKNSKEHEATFYDGRKILVTTRPLTVGQLVVLTDVTVTCKLQERISHMERLSTIGKMAASLAHQIRTPLSAAMLYAANLCNKTLDLNSRKSFGAKLLDRLKDLENQVSDVLLFARAGEKIVEKVDIKVIVEKAKMNAEALLKRYNARLDIKMKDENMTILANVSALSGALSNLIVNALEAGANHLFIDIDSKNDMLILKIADNGKGMPKNILSKVFDPFYTTKSNGTGLGLAVVNSVVHAHQGRLGFVSEENKGTCFNLTFPLVLKEPEELKVEAA
jgi:two-component system sensor histidine kinase FlrB